MSSPYTPKFDKNPMGKFDSKANFLSIKGGTDAYLLEDELNELQWLQTEARAQLIRKIANSGCVDVESFGSQLDGGLNELLDSQLNSFEMNPFYSVLNGYLTYISSSTGPMIVKLPPPPIQVNDIRYDFIYLEFNLCEVKGKINSSKNNDNIVYEYGGIDNKELPFDIIDNSLYGLESTRRVQLRWKIRVLKGLDYSKFNKNGFVDNNGLSNKNLKPYGNTDKAQDLVYIQHPKDKGLFIAGNGKDNIQTLKTIDGYTYAIPLFIVKRLNNAGYNSITNSNGSTDYVDKNSISGRPDGKFSNIIYKDQVIDLRYMSKLGEDQFSKIYITYNIFEEYKKQVDDTLSKDLSKLKNDLMLLDIFVNNTIFPDLQRKAYTSDAQKQLNDLRVYIDEEIAKLLALINNINVSIETINIHISNILGRLTSLEEKVTRIEEVLKQIDVDIDFKDHLTYNLNMRRSTALTTGGFLYNNDIMESVGATIQVPFSDYNLYTVNNTIYQELIGEVGDIWVCKGDTNYLIKNTGLAGIQMRTFNFEVDGVKIKKGNGILGGYQSDGVIINVPIADTDFISISLTDTSYKGVAGDIYIEIINGGFKVKNTGSANINFEWLIIDSTKSRNTIVKDIELTGNGSTIDSILDIGTNFDVMLGCVISPQTTPGTLGEIYVTRSFNTYSINYTGNIRAKIRCMIFREVNIETKP